MTRLRREVDDVALLALVVLVVPLLAAVGLAPVAISVVTAFAVQALLGGLACRAAADVAAAWSGGARGLTWLEGYAVPPRRFAALLFALPPGDRAFPILRQIYNVTWEVALPSRSRLALNPLGPAAGPAWFSASVARATWPRWRASCALPVRAFIGGRARCCGSPAPIR